MSRFLACVAVFVALAVAGRPADACLPDGATNVPINLAEVFTGYAFAQPAAYVRKAGTETAVSRRIVDEWGLQRIQFMAPLEPNTVYEVVYGGPFSTFVTGDASDIIAPAAITVDEVAIRYATLASADSCGSEVVDVLGPVLEAEPLLRVRVTGAGLTQERMVPLRLHVRPK